MLTLLPMLGSKCRETSEAQLPTSMAVNRGCQGARERKKLARPEGFELRPSDPKLWNAHVSRYRSVAHGMPQTPVPQRFQPCLREAPRCCGCHRTIPRMIEDTPKSPHRAGAPGGGYLSRTCWFLPGVPFLSVAYPERLPAASSNTIAVAELHRAAWSRLLGA